MVEINNRFVAKALGGGYVCLCIKIVKMVDVGK